MFNDIAEFKTNTRLKAEYEKLNKIPVNELEKEDSEVIKEYLQLYQKIFKQKTYIENQNTVKNFGGLRSGTERHESRRIDDQLRGRSGRQEILVHLAFLCLEDKLLRIFGGDQILGVMQNIGLMIMHLYNQVF